MHAADHLQQTGRTYARLGRREFSYFSGCDYFRLASDPRVLGAARAAVDRLGLNVSASRVTTGNHAAYSQLERALQSYFKAASARLVSTGYLAGIALAQALKGSVFEAFIDERAHPALHDAATAFQCPITLFKHRDPKDLGRCLSKCRAKRSVVVLTDGLFAADGSIAPLADYLAVLPGDALLVVDDAHGAGVLGLYGRGTPEHCGLRDQRIIQLITLSKAFGTYGGVILGARRFSEQITLRSGAFIGSTPMPLPLVEASLASVRILAQQGQELRGRLSANVEFVRGRLRSSGLQVPDLPGPIIALEPRNPRAASRLRRALLEHGIYPPFIRYPGAPKNGVFRFVISSEHSQFQLERLAKVLSGFRFCVRPEGGCDQ